jgi:predicted N-formylglutamate amidohydrolase
VSGRRTGAPPTLVLTCEHAGHRVPRQYARLFAGAEGVLESHQGWDPGALRLARLLARRLERPLLVTRWSRLLVESNRSPTNPRIWSRFTRELPPDERESILDRYWWPHRQAVEAEIAAAIAGGERVVHVAVHSFTPLIDGDVRNADVAFLFDSKRVREAEFARRWSALLCQHAPGMRVRYNYPYRGSADGLATWLRRRHPVARYLGFELEVNQALAAASGWRSVGEALAASLAEALSSRHRAGAVGDRHDPAGVARQRRTASSSRRSAPSPTRDHG